MEGGEIIFSPGTLIRILLALLYIPVCLIVYRRLFPRLSPTSRLLASVMLVAQIVVIIVSLEGRLTTRFEGWFWNLELGRNIPTILASTQLAMVGGVALASAWLVRAKPTGNWRYLLGFALVFFLLGIDELYARKDFDPNWKIHYTMIGATMVVATLIVTMRSPRQSRVWHASLLTGLFLVAAGGIVLDDPPAYCATVAFLRIDGCLELHFLDESLELLGVWLALVSLLGRYSDASPRPHPFIPGLLYVLPILWILTPFRHTVLPYLEFRLLSRPIAVKYESNVELQAYRIDSEENALTLQFFLSAPDWRSYTQLGYSVQFVDQLTGESIASTDERLGVSQGWRFEFHDGEKLDNFWIYKQRVAVPFPLQVSTNRAFWVALSIWRKKGDEIVSKNIISSDHTLLNETWVVLGERLGPSETAASSSTPAAVPYDGFTLDSSDMSDHAKTDDIASITFVRGSAASVQFESELRVRGFLLDHREGTSIVRIYASARREVYKALGYSIHMIDQVSGTSVFSYDEWTDPTSRFFEPDFLPVYHQAMEIDFPSQMPTNRVLWLVLSIWRKEGDAYVRQKIISSDQPLLSETQVILGEFVLQAEPVASSSIPIAIFENGFTLDAAGMPASAQAGETLSIPFAWRTDKDGREDFVQFLHLGHEASGAWWVHDQQPLGPRLPTRVWYSGLGDSETWEVPLLADLAPGRYKVFTGLYRVSDQGRQPASNAEGTPFVDARVPLGLLTIEGA